MSSAKCVVFLLFHQSSISFNFDDYLNFLFSQKDNVRNQRENVVLTIANAQSRLGIPVEADPVSCLVIFTNVIGILQKNFMEGH